MITNDCDITYLKGIGEKRAKLYAKIGIYSKKDLTEYYPKNYVDFSQPKSIREIVDGETCAFRGKVIAKLAPHSGRITVYRLIVSDDSYEMSVVFFNSYYSFERLVLNEEYLFYGKVKCDLVNKETLSPLFIRACENCKLIAKYPLTAGLSNTIISKNIKTALEASEFQDALPKNIREKAGLCSLKEALFDIHFPESEKKMLTARKRLVFEELLTLRLGLSLIKEKKQAHRSAEMSDVNMNEFYDSLSFQPTNAQMRAISECISDMKSGIPMNRLLQGDVGSGKTLVAAAIMYFAARNGFQSVIMAPTEILAKQHFETFSKILSPLGISVGLLTSGMSAKEKKEIKKNIFENKTLITTGTQALIQKDVKFAHLGLCVTDEQHRFGVKQRESLLDKGIFPHSLIMSATPIPRTLALMIYADLDISILNEMPKGRLPIKTYGVDSSFHERIYKFIQNLVKQGLQAYIVCPLVEEGISEKTAAVSYFDKLKQGQFSQISLGLLHGKMKQADKDKVMSDFKENKISVLISTTVIEVGIDVPKAVVMVIENAEQFGLSQLHQLRGRVGRGKFQSYCIMISDSKSEHTKERIKAMTETCDGFEIANKDLQLRGPGDFFGCAQHGLPPLKIADMTRDIETINLVQKCAYEILAEDKNLSLEKNAGLKKSVELLFNGRESFSIN